jgi:hypothetical protein
MIFNGVPLSAEFHATCLLRRGNAEPLAVTLKPLSLGFHQRLRRVGIVPPQPPTKIARDSNGKPMRDGRGNVLTVQDAQHPDYLAGLEDYHRCVGVLAIAESLRGNTELRLESIPPTGEKREEWIAFVQSVLAEMEQAGFTAGDLPLLCREICRLSNLLDDQLAATQANFSSLAEAGSG